ncbi:hypothetical protein Hanom_Chr15g01400161 [Helianthus anomalus]
MTLCTTIYDILSPFFISIANFSYPNCLPLFFLCFTWRKQNFEKEKDRTEKKAEEAECRI